MRHTQINRISNYINETAPHHYTSKNRKNVRFISGKVQCHFYGEIIDRVPLYKLYTRSHHKIIKMYSTAHSLSKPARLHIDDTDHFREYIQTHCRQLLPNCRCISCNIAQKENILIPSLMKSRSAHTSRYSMSKLHSCEETKNVSLIRCIGMGVSNQMPRLLNIFYDINSRLVFDEFKLRRLNNQSDSKYDDEDEDSDDDDDDEPTPSLDAFTSNESIHSVLPLLNHIESKHAFLSKMPIEDALRTCFDRLAAPLTFSPRYLIQDNLAECLSQISLTTSIIKRLMNEHSGMPIQLDVCMIHKNVKQNELNPPIKLVTKAKDFCKDRLDNRTPCPPEMLSEHKLHHHYEDDIGKNIMDRLKALPDHQQDNFFDFAIAVPVVGDVRMN